MRRAFGATAGGDARGVTEESRVAESAVAVVAQSSSMPASAHAACRNNARPCVSVVKAISAPFSANKALRAVS
eukprot:6183124-Pleurochrysis_carterae.AAC.1